MHKKIIVFLALFLIFLPFKSSAAESIESFITNIALNRDGSIIVEENILYDFGAEERHGIYRDIPVTYKARGGNYQLRISDISALDQSGNSYHFETSHPGSYLRIKIGDADKTITGKHLYKITYTVRRAINYFSSHDELYWNSTGNGWTVPIGEAKTVVYLPGEFDAKQILRTCYFGLYKSNEVCNMSAELSGAGKVSELVFSADNLGPGEGLTVVVGVPAGTLAKPSLASVIWDVARDNLIVLLPIVVFILLFRRWKKYGKDAKGRGIIIPEYEVPDNLSPAEVGAILGYKVDKHDISAEIIYLAIKGYIKIRRIESESILARIDYEFIKLKSPDDLEKEIHKTIMKGLFKKDATEVKLSKLKYKFAKVMSGLIDTILSDMTNEGYFVKNPRAMRSAYFVFAFLIFLYSFLYLFVPLKGIFVSLIGFVSTFSASIIVFVFGYLMVALTEKGAAAKDRILGLKMYLMVAEKARIEFHNAPEKNPEQFEKFLPYAMVMKVEKEWASQFEGIYDKQPDWYEDPSHAGLFNAVALTGVMSSFDIVASSSLSATVSTAASGGSGFSGGGSGGGFGGGGGGSW